MTRNSLKEIREFLASNYLYDNEQKSSHWRFHTKDAKINKDGKVKNIDGFSQRSRRFPFSNFLHRRAQKKIFAAKEYAFDGQFWQIAKNFCSAQSRSLDLCVMRHVFTFEYLHRFGFLGTAKKVCVIGDGQSNFVSMAIESHAFSKVISVNLTEVLLSDLDLVEKLNLKEGEVCLARTPIDLTSMLCEPNCRLIMVRAADAQILQNSGIDLFVNIASFQEMDIEQINKYFELIESNAAWLYCCNRRTKRLYEGEELIFGKYPWGSSIVELDEDCPWHQSYYDFKSLRLFRRFSYDGAVQHRIAKFPTG